MIKYKIEYKKGALKFLKKLPLDHRTRIQKAICNLPNGDIKRMFGIKNQILYRLRVR